MWAKLRCYFGFHRMDSPTAGKRYVDSFYYCKDKCGSYTRWEQGLPRYGAWRFFGKLKAFMVTVEDKK